MLVLQRRKNEEIIITVPPSSKEQKIVVMVTEFKRVEHGEDIAAVRLGVTAAREVTVHRGEVQDRIDADESMKARRP